MNTISASDYIFQLFSLDLHGKPIAFLGTAFPIASDGTLATCGHVVSKVSLPQRIGVWDNRKRKLTAIPQDPLFPSDGNVDMALLPNALRRNENEFFRLLPPQLLAVGQDVYTFGFFELSREQDELSGGIEYGYFGGKVVAFKNDEDPSRRSLILPFPILEGMSGSPVLTYHRGPKLVGIAKGNRESKILAHSVMDYSDEKGTVKEEIHRVTEFGIAYHCAAIELFLLGTPIQGYVVSSDRE